MITEKNIQKIAELSRLSLTEEELQSYSQQLSSILEHFQKLAAVNTDGVEPLVTPTDMVEHWRDDCAETWAAADRALEQAPEKVGNLFKVPPVVGS